MTFAELHNNNIDFVSFSESKFTQKPPTWNTYESLAVEIIIQRINQEKVLLSNEKVMSGIFSWKRKSTKPSHLLS